MNTSTQAPLSVGIIGLGVFAVKRRAWMRDAGVFDLQACFDSNRENCLKIAQEENAQPMDSLEQLLAVPGLEGVVISTGADSHASLAIAAMRAGLHVFIEKPLCPSVEDIRQICQAQQETDRIVGIGHNHHDNDMACRLYQQLARNQTLGDIVAYQENSSHGGGFLIQSDTDWRGLPGRNPGGMLFQCGVHSFHRLIHLFGPIESVYAMMRYDIHKVSKTSDATQVLIRHRSGITGTLTCHHVTAYCHDFSIFGTHATLAVNSYDNTATLQKRMPGTPEHREPIAPPPVPEKAHYLNLLSWHNAIRGTGSPSPSLEDSINAVLPVFAAERSAKDDRPVKLSELENEVECDEMA